MKILTRTLFASIVVLVIAWSTSVFAGNVIQTAQFPGLSPGTLYNAYLSSKQHSAMTGYPATYYRPPPTPTSRWVRKAMNCVHSAYRDPAANCST